MENDRSVALKAFINLRDILTNTPADVIRSLCEAREVRQALDQIFDQKYEAVNNKRSQPVCEDSGPSKCLRILQPLSRSSNSETLQSTRNNDETISSLTLSTSTHSCPKQPCTGFNDSNPSTLIPSFTSSCQPSERIPPSVPSTSTKLIPPSQTLSPPRPPVSVRDLIKVLDASSKMITEALRNQELKAAMTTQAQWVTEDPRVVDIQIANISKIGETHKARRTFAQRGLAEEYRRWRIHQHKRDIIKELVANPKARAKTGSLDDFLDAHSKNFHDIRTVREGLHHGLKMLLLEQLFGEPTISAILNFRYLHFMKVDRGDLNVLCAAVRNSTWIMELVRSFPSWLEDCQVKYDACMDQSDMATDLNLQHTIQVPHASTRDSTVEHGSGLCSVAPCGGDSRRHEDLPGETEGEIDPNPCYSKWSNASNPYSYMLPFQEANNAQQEESWESYQTYFEQAWTTVGLRPDDLGTSLLGPELYAHASASAPSLDYLQGDIDSFWAMPP